MIAAADSTTVPAAAPCLYRTRKAAPDSVLFSRSGGGMPGLDIHAGIWLALEEAGIRSTVNVGTSAGAIVAAFDSAGWRASDFCRLLAGLRDDDVRKERFAWKARIPWIDWWMDNQPIRRLLKQYLPTRFDQLRKPLRVYVTDESNGQPRALASGGVVDCVLASMAVSGVFPPVKIVQGLTFSDGGPVANLPVPEDIVHFGQVYLCVAKRPVDYAHRRTGMLSRLLYNVDLMAEDQVLDAISLVRHVHMGATVLRPEVSASTGMLRFNHDFITRAHLQCTAALRKRGNRS